jgi:hypothetical protein
MIFKLEGDEIALQYLGAATALQWASLPKESQTAIMEQAMHLGGLPPTTQLKEQISLLIRRNSGT